MRGSIDFQYLTQAADSMHRLAYQAKLESQAKIESGEQKGLEVIINDLEGTTTEGTGWKLKPGGKLNIKFHANQDEVQSFLDQQLGGKPWYQTVADLRRMQEQGKQFPRLNLPTGFKASPFTVKLLGPWFECGANDIFDVVLKEDGNLAVRLGVRSKTGQRCVLGRFVEYKELSADDRKLLLVETAFLKQYGSELFAPNTPSLTAAQSIDADQVTRAVAELLQENKFLALEAFKQDILNIFRGTAPFAVKLNQAGQLVKDLTGKTYVADGQTLKFDAATIGQLSIEIRYELYKRLFPTEFGNFAQFHLDRMTVVGELENWSDQKSTNQSCVRSLVAAFLSVGARELATLEKEWKLVAGGGFNIDSIAIVPLEDIVKSPMFSSHCYFVLQGVYQVIVNNYAKLKQNTKFEAALQKQLQAIQATVLALETEKLNLVSAPSSTAGALVPFQRRDGSTQDRIPVISTPAELLQFSTVYRNVFPRDLPIVLAGTVEIAADELETRMTDANMAYLDVLFTEHGFPLSFKVDLNKLAGFNEIHLLVDNSGSMGTAMGSGTRWGEAERRATEIVTLLALVRAKFTISFLNPQLENVTTPKIISKQFDFSQYVGDNAEGRLADALAEARSWIVTTFSFRDLSGNYTPVAANLSRIFQGANADNKKLVVFLFDGKPEVSGDYNSTNTEEMRTKQVLAGVNSNYISVIFSACTDDASALKWTDEFRKSQQSSFAVIFPHQKMKTDFERVHGPLIEITENMWFALHLSARISGQEIIGLSALHDIFVALEDPATQSPLTQMQMTQIYGYDIAQTYHERYLSGYRGANSSSRAAAASRVMPLVQPPVSFGASSGMWTPMPNTARSSAQINQVVEALHQLLGDGRRGDKTANANPRLTDVSQVMAEVNKLSSLDDKLRALEDAYTKHLRTPSPTRFTHTGLAIGRTGYHNNQIKFFQEAYGTLLQDVHGSNAVIQQHLANGNSLVNSHPQLKEAAVQATGQAPLSFTPRS